MSATELCPWCETSPKVRERFRFRSLTIVEETVRGQATDAGWKDGKPGEDTCPYIV